jgi:rod shape-determining protein MreB
MRAEDLQGPASLPESRAVLSALEQMPPESSGDLIDFGIMLAGGDALPRNLDLLFREETKLPIKIPTNPRLAVAVEAGMAVSNLEILRGVRKAHHEDSFIWSVK